MNITELIEHLQTFNAWRRGSDQSMPDPITIGKVIDKTCELLSEFEQLHKDKERLDWLDSHKGENWLCSYGTLGSAQNLIYLSNATFGGGMKTVREAIDAAITENEQRQKAKKTKPERSKSKKAD